jgi:chromosome segregation ATPase
MKVTGSRAASKLGLWEVNVSVNDVPVAETDFMLVDYTTLFDTIIGLETSVMELTFAKEQISQQHDLLQGEYNQLSDAYDKLRIRIDEYNQSSASLISNYEELLTEYEELSENIDQLQSDYDDLLLDYNEQDRSSLETRRELENTQRILIISIAISIFVLILYMKRRVSN